MNEGIVVEDAVLRTIALTIARNEVGAKRPIEELLTTLGMTADEYEQLCENHTFVQYVDQYTVELTENGFSFAAKARVLAEDLLPTAYSMASDKLMPPPVRAKMIENLVEWGGLKPKQQQADVGAGTGFSITINLGSGAVTTQKAEKVVKHVEKTPEKAQKTPKLPKLSVVEAAKTETATVGTAPIVDRETVKNKLAALFEEGDEYEYAGDDVL